MFGKEKPGAIASIAREKVKSSEGYGSLEPSMHTAAGESVLAAIKSGDAKALMEHLYRAMDMHHMSKMREEPTEAHEGTEGGEDY